MPNEEEEEEKEVVEVVVVHCHKRMKRELNWNECLKCIPVWGNLNSLLSIGFATRRIRMNNAYEEH